MKDVLEIDKKNMFSIKAAATATGYSRDYITKLARDGKIVATQVGRQWYLDLESLTQYATIADLEQKVRNKHLSEERHRERLVAEQKESNELSRQKLQVRFNRELKMTVPGLALGFLLLSATLTTFLHNQVLLKSQVASVSQSALETSEDTVFSLEKNPVVFSETTSPETKQFAQMGEAIVLLPQFSNATTTTEVQDLFSDDVSVRVDATGQTFVYTVDENGMPSGEEVPYVKVPVNKEMP